MPDIFHWGWKLWPKTVDVSSTAIGAFWAVASAWKWLELLEDSWCVGVAVQNGWKDKTCPNQMASKRSFFLEYYLFFQLKIKIPSTKILLVKDPPFLCLLLSGWNFGRSHFKSLGTEFRDKWYSWDCQSIWHGHRPRKTWMGGMIVKSAMRFTKSGRLVVRNVLICEMLSKLKRKMNRCSLYVCYF